MNNILIITKPNCTECERIKSALDGIDMAYSTEDMETLDIAKQFELKGIARKNRQVSMPMIFVDGEFMATRKFENEFLK